MRLPLPFQIASLLVAILIVFSLVGAIDMRVEDADAPKIHQAMQRAAAARELERGLRGCPPPKPGMTDIVVMIVRSESDTAPVVERCMRFAEASYLRRSR